MKNRHCTRTQTESSFVSTNDRVLDWWSGINMSVFGQFGMRIFYASAVNIFLSFFGGAGVGRGGGGRNWFSLLSASLPREVASRKYA